MSSEQFSNRTGNNLNRRKLTIVSQTANEMIVDVETQLFLNKYNVNKKSDIVLNYLHKIYIFNTLEK